MTDPFNPSPRLADRLEAMDKEIRAWALLTRKQLLFKLASLGLHERVQLANSIKLEKSLKSYIRKKGGDIETVAFSFARHGIFLERGVGKGRPVNSPQANHAAKPWLAPTLPKAVQSLADLLADEYADIVALEARIIIPGIIDTKIR